MKKLMIILISITILLPTLISGCTNRSSNNEDTKVSNESPNDTTPNLPTDDASIKDTTTQATTTSDISVDTSNQTTIMFIGNSLTSTGLTPQAVRGMIKENDVDYEVIDLTKDGYSLMQHYYWFEKRNREKAEEADIVIFQEHGAPDYPTTEALSQLMPLFRPETKFYMMLTDWDMDPEEWDENYDEVKYDYDRLRDDELLDIEGLNFIWTGKVHNILINEFDFDYEVLHEYNDYHPNYFYGYLSALNIFSTITSIPCEEVKYTLSSLLKECIPGETEEEKNAAIDVCIGAISDVLKENEE